MPSLADLQKMLEKEPDDQQESAVNQEEESPYLDEGPPDNAIEITNVATIEEGLAEAAEILHTSPVNLDYEVVNKARGGLFGLFKRPYKLLVWVSGDMGSRPQVATSTHFGDMLGMDTVEENTDKPKDGRAFILVRKSGVFLRVTPPANGGKALKAQDIETSILARTIKGFDQGLVKKLAGSSEVVIEKIADYKPDPEHDSKAMLEVSQDEMLAILTMTPPILGGRQLEPDEITKMLEDHEVKFGIQMDRIKEALDNERYNIPINVAEGKKPIHGADAEVEYKFNINPQDTEFKEDEQGRINYMERNIVQNVVAGQVLAIRKPAGLGIQGRTVTNKLIEARNGEDKPFEPGKNCELSNDRNEIISKIAGQAIFVQGRINVEPIYEVKGDVDLKVGNIVFLGSVIVKGSVQDGFSIKAAGNVEVGSNIGKCIIEADGDVIVKQGILGKNESSIKAKNVMAKFMENANVYASGTVKVRESILHSYVDAGDNVICFGKKAQIVGGRVRAKNQIIAKNFGSVANPDTSLEAGLDPQIKDKLLDLEAEKAESIESLEKFDININTIEAHRDKKTGQLPEDKQAILDKMTLAKKDIEDLLVDINKDIEDLNAYLSELEPKGKISARETVFPGVDLTIINANLKTKNDFKKVTFVNENGFIRPLPYQDDGLMDKQSTVE